MGESENTNMGDGVARVIAPDTVPHFCAVGVTDRVVLTLVCQWSTLITAFSENLVRAPFKKKNWVAGPQQPWSIASGVYNRNGGRYWSCTLVHTPIICIYGRLRLLHN